jgi:hypothetical protein
MIVAGTIELLPVGDEGPEQPAELDQAMPVAAITGETGGVETEDDPNSGEADVGNQAPEARALLGRGARAAEILVDDLDQRAGPAQGNGALDQAVLEIGALAVVDYLAR